MSKPTLSVDEKLILFGNSVLRIMEQTLEWNADMLDEIGTIATDLGLAGLNEQHEFISLVDRKGASQDGQ